MNIKHLYRITRRLNDFKYIKFVIKHFYNKILLKYQLCNLQNYHFGKEKDFQSTRNKKLIKTIKYAYSNTEYYRRIFDENGIDINNINKHWTRIPLLDKDIIRKENKNILAFPDTKDYIGFSTTGGSTGQPLGFYRLGGVDAEHQEFLYKIMGYTPGDKILAMDGTLVPENLLNLNIFWVDKSKNDIPYGSVALSSQYLTSENIQFYIEFIKKFSPAIIRGYPSFIDSIAVYILNNNINLDIQIKGIELTSESFFDYQVANIKKAFNTKVFTQYGHTESSIFGYSVAEDLKTYCSPFYGYTEVIGDDLAHVKQGEIGEVVVTGFNNYAMPFIRYRTGDLAIYDGEENGIIKLKRIFGRTQDYIYTNKMEKILLTAIVFGRHYKAFDNIKKWQIVQNAPGEVIFKIVKNPYFSTNDQEELQNSFYEIAQIKTRFEFVETLPLTPRGKSKFLIQNLKV